MDVKLQQVRPLSFDDPSSFRPGGPYSLTSRAYTADFNEVKALGRVDSPTRTPEQTETVRFWTEHTMIQFNRTVRNLAMAKRLGTVETARLMAMVHVSGADSAVSCWDASTTTTSGGPSMRSSVLTRTETRTQCKTPPGRTCFWATIRNTRPDMPVLRRA